MDHDDAVTELNILTVYDLFYMINECLCSLICKSLLFGFCSVFSWEVGGIDMRCS